MKRTRHGAGLRFPQIRPLRIAADGVDVPSSARVAGEPAKEKREGERDPNERGLPDDMGLRNGAVLVRENGRGNLTAAGINDDSAPVDGERP
jgi:hypothetical protein